MKRTHTIIRRCREYGPDGESVGRTERLDVVIEWPDPGPEELRGAWQRDQGIYYTVGDWTLADEGIGVLP